MRFKWSNKSSEQAAICMAVARVRCKGLTVEAAVAETLQTGRHCRNPEAISETQLRRLHKLVGQTVLIKKIEEDAYAVYSKPR